MSEPKRVIVAGDDLTLLGSEGQPEGMVPVADGEGGITFVPKEDVTGD